MIVGNRVFYYEDESLENSILKRKPGGISYIRIIGDVVRVYNRGQRVTAYDIEKFFNFPPGSRKFIELYREDHRKKRIVVETELKDIYFFTEDLWEKYTFGDKKYLEIVPNSFDFIYGDN